LKLSQKNKKGLKSSNQNSDSINSSKNLIEQIKENKIYNRQKMVQKNQKIVKQLKNNGLLK
jgi:predicted transcriptional regulator YheO